MQEKTQFNLWDLTLKEIYKQWGIETLKLIPITLIVVFKRGVDALSELISGKVIIPMIFFWLSTKIQVEGLDNTINSLIQLSTFAVSSGGAMIYKYKKDVKKIEEKFE